MTHALCLAHLTLIELAPPQVVEAAAAAGFELVSLRLAPASAGEHQHPMIGGTPMMRETLARLRDLGVRVNDVELIRLTGDAPRERPHSEEELLFQARQARLPPGRGGLDLQGMLRAIPADSVISIETPMHGRPDLLPPVERARMLRQATLDVIDEAGRRG